MPLGSHHGDEGLLLREGLGVVLARDDGGRWRLNFDEPAPGHLLGRRVRVQGMRSGFDRLEVTGMAGLTDDAVGTLFVMSGWRAATFWQRCVKACRAFGSVGRSLLDLGAGGRKEG